MTRICTCVLVALGCAGLAPAGLADPSPAAEPQPATTVKAYAADDLLARRDAEGKTTYDPAPLMKVLTEVVERDSWTPGAGGKIEAAAADRAGTLLVTQTAAGHQQIAEVLAALRQAAKDAPAGKPIVRFGSTGTSAADAALRRKVAFDFDQEPLGNVIGQLTTRYGLDVRRDVKALKEAGIPADYRVTLHVKDISLASALRLMLRGSAASYTLDEGTLLFTTEEEAESPFPAVYPVGDLLGDGNETGRLAPEQLASLLRDTCCPTTWREVGGAGALQFISLPNVQAMIITQSYAVHRDAAVLLGQLRTVAKAVTADKGGPAAVPLDRSPEEQVAYEAVGRALAKKITLKRSEEPLAEVAAKVGKLAGVNMVFDRRALDDAGINLESPVTVSVENAEAGSVLRDVLRPAGATFMICDEVAYVTTPEEAEARLRAVAYTTTALDGNLLRDLVVSAIEPTTWADVGGPGLAECVAFGKFKVLVVSQTGEVHGEIADALSALHKIAQDTTAGRPALRYGLSFADAPDSALGKVLARKVTLDIDKQPFDQVIAQIQRSCGLNVQIDWRQLDECNVDGHAPASIHVKGCSLRSALRLMLRDVGLAGYPQDDALVITVPEQAESRMFVAFYPVADLADRHDKSGTVTYDYARLIETVTSIIDPTTWDSVGGPGSVVPIESDRLHVLCVSQTVETHEKTAALLTALRSAGRQAAQGPAAEAVFLSAYATEEEARKAIDKALAAPVPVQLNGLPLAKAIEQVRQAAGINVVLDRRSLEQAGIADTVSLALAVNKVSLGSALNLALHPLGLAWIVRNEVLMITTADEAEANLAVAVYPVADLLAGGGSKGEPGDKDDRLIEQITSDVAPNTWDAAGGPGSIVAFGPEKARVLVVAQTEIVHRRVAQLLAKARAAAKQG